MAKSMAFALGTVCDIFLTLHL